MANQEHMKILMQGVDAWNEWRQRELTIEPDLRQAQLNGMNLRKIDFRWTNLAGASLQRAALSGANLFAANLQGADLSGADLGYRGLNGEQNTHAANLAAADLREANLRKARLVEVDLTEADLREADLSGANLNDANLSQAKLSHANLQEACLIGAMLFYTDLTGAHLRETDLNLAYFNGANLSGADISSSHISTANIIQVRLQNAVQQDLIVDFSPTVTVDTIEVAQLAIAFLRYPRLQEVVKSMTTELAFIIGDFADERGQVLAMLKEAMRTQNYIPLALDCADVRKREIITYLTPLASLARFILLDLTGMKRFGEDLQQLFTAQNQVPTLAFVQADASDESLVEQLREVCSTLQVHSYMAREDVREKAREMIELAGQKVEQN